MKKDFVTTSVIFDRDGEEMEIDVFGNAIYSVDKDYGSDADGTRGSKRIFLEDVIEVTGDTQDGEDFIFTENELEQAKNALAQQFLDE